MVKGIEAESRGLVAKHWGVKEVGSCFHGLSSCMGIGPTSDRC